MMKHYNVSAHQGISDLEACRLMGVDPSLANTEELNSVCIAKVYERNLVAEKQGALEEGMSIQDAEKHAKAKAEQGKNETLARLDARLKATGKGYMEF